MTGAVTGNADTATEATNVTVSANNSTDETVYPVFVDGATSTQGIESDTGLTYNPSTGVITATQFTGNVTGNVTGNASGTAATVTTAAQPNITSTGTLTSFRSTGIDDNADALAMTLDSSERLIIGHTASISGVQHMKIQVYSTTYDGSISLGRWNDAGNASYLSFIKSRNGTIGSNTIVQDGDTLGTIAWNGDDGTDFGTRAGSISMVVDGTPGANDMPGRLEFYTTPDGSSSNLLRMTIGNTGHITVAKSAAITEAALTDGSTAVNAATQQNCTLVLQENTTIGVPSSPVAGQILVFEISQHASSGPYTLAWNSVFEFAASTAPTMTATDNKCDIFTFRYNGSKWQEIGRSQNMAVS